MNFADRMKEVIRKSLANQKAISEQALKPAQGFGKQGILYHEINELEKDVENKFFTIGNEVYVALMKKRQNTISKNTGEIKELLLEIAHIEKLILEKEILLRQAD